MRDRLIKLLRDAPKTDTVYGDIKLPYPVPTLQTIADHLLAEGVIVPPCKTGDVVYELCEDFGSIFRCQIHSMNYVDGIWQGTMMNTWVGALGSIYNWTETEFGTSIFFTEKEAEEARAERIKNGGD